MAGARRAMTASTGPSTAIAIRANFFLDKIRNVRHVIPIDGTDAPGPLARRGEAAAV